MDAGLPNNAVAVCKKVMRNLPDRYSIHLKMGQIRAAQGFITDARSSFVTYAESVQAAGDLDEAFRALIEFVNLAPDDYEICMILGAQLEQNNRADEALTQYIGAYRIMRRQGLSDLAHNVAARIRKMDPQLDLEEAASDEVFSRGGGAGSSAAASGAEGSASEAEVEIIGPVDLPLMSFDDDDDDEVAAPTPASTQVADQAAAKAAEEVAAALAEEAAAKAAEEAAAKEAEEAAAKASAKAAAEAEGEAAAKAAAEAAAKTAEEAAAKAAEEAATKAAEEAAATIAAEAAERIAEEAAERVAEEAATRAAEEAAAAKAADGAAAGAAEEAAAAKAAEETGAAKAAEETAAAKAAEETGAAKAAEETGAAKAAEDAGAEVAEPKADPGGEKSSSDDPYVDIAAMLLGDEEHNVPKSTRFVVPYEEPTGDDQADFERMLEQFKKKVSENIDTSDVAAHYDLGTAYMEMGLLDEAIGEFQMVLRGASDHLPTYEMLGHTFLEKQEPEAALQSLTRGLDAPCEIEEERVGIYYYLGLAHETIGNTDTAMEFYDKVFAIDINFADVTERLRGLRN
jgi:tetratricopeptide (TPR) repeat protein